MVKAGASEWKLRPKERAGWVLTGIQYTYETDAETEDNVDARDGKLRPEE